MDFHLDLSSDILFTFSCESMSVYSLILSIQNVQIILKYNIRTANVLYLNCTNHFKLISDHSYLLGYTIKIWFRLRHIFANE